MKSVVLHTCLILSFLFLGSIPSYAQLDNETKSIAIGAKETNEVETPKMFSLEKSPEAIISGGIRIERNESLKNLGKTSAKKEVYFMKGEQFAQKSYDKLENKLNEQYSTSRDRELKPEYQNDQYLGDFKSGSKFVRFIYRDHEYVDGDRIRVWINNEIAHPNIFLTGEFKGFYMDLEEGFNRIDIEALNQGSSGPNTAQFIIYDDQRNEISSNMWLLATGAKATVIIVKDKASMLKRELEDTKVSSKEGN